MYEIRKSSVLKIIIDKIEELEKHRKTLYEDTDGNEIHILHQKIRLLKELFKKMEEL